MNKAIFLDRDGVINVEKDYVINIRDFEFIDGIFDTLKRIQDKGYLIIVITNQSGIARGYYSEADFHTLTEWMIDQFRSRGINITKVYFSPFHPEHGIGKYKKDTNCRKPNPGMILDAASEFDIDLKKSILVGDKETDILAGINAGIINNVLVKSGHKVDENNTKASMVIDSIKYLNVI